ncbi:MAG: replication-associated recombination protein A [Micrococcales bacterium]
MTSDQSIFATSVPLAARMRPRGLSEVVGQEHLLKPGSPLRQLATAPVPGRSTAGTSVLLWGPPGTGKTTLAGAIARDSGRRFVELSAITAGVKDVREVMIAAQRERDAYGTGTLLFLDEIHRFSKAQQDALLPGVEAGWVTLIAATTENPSFSVIAPLLSRSLLLTLEPLTESDIAQVLQRAVSDPRGLAGELSVADPEIDQIVLLAQGDARRALTVLEAAAAHAQTAGRKTIDREDIEESLDHALVRYDRVGDQHYDIISAFIKSVRGSDADAAIHWLARMIEGGEDPRFIARRLMILASEDIGLADPQALPLAVAAFETVQQIGMPEGRIPLAEVTIYLALAPKSNAAYNAINAALEDVRAGLQPGVPKPLRSSNYAGAKSRGNGVGYKYPHDDPKAVLEQDYVTGKVAKRRYYQPKEVGFERELGERWAKLRAIIRGLGR